MYSAILHRPLRALAVFVAVVSAGVMAAYWTALERSFERLRDDTLAMHEQHALDLADAVAQDTGNLVRGVDLALQRLRETYAGEPESFVRTVRTVRASFPDGAIANIAVLDASGRTVYSAIGGTPRVDGAADHLRFFRDGGADELWFSKPRPGPLSKVWVVVFARRLARNGHFAGEVLMTMRADFLGRALARLVDRDSGNIISLFDADGTYIARSTDLERVLGRSVPRDRPFLAASAPQRGVFRAEGAADGVPRIFAWRRLEGIHMTVSVGISAARVLAPIEAQIARSRRSNAFGSALVAAALAMVLALMMKVERQQRRIDEDEDALRIAKTAFDAAAEGIIVTDAAKRIVSVNPAFTRITGYTAAEVIGRTPKMVASGLHDAGFYQRMWKQINADGGWDGEVTNRHKEGRLFVVWLKIRAIVNEDPRLHRYVAVITDITRRKEREEAGWRHANFDALTGLPTRRLLLDHLRRAVAHAARARQQLAVLFIDLDDFKPVNDRFGHPSGDKLLKQLASRLVNALRDEDTVGRLGGDEFVAILPCVDGESDAIAAANKLLGALAAPAEVAGERVSVSASIGIALFAAHGRGAEELIERADAAMYRAKQSGGNAVAIASAASAIDAEEMRIG